MFMNRWLLIAAALLGSVPPCSAGTLDQEILKATPPILAALKARGVQNVGVLKFLVAEGKGRPTDVGELTQTLADRLELALILTVDVKEPIGVLRNATAVAARTPGADHRTAEGRDRLFAAQYSP